MKLTDSPFDHLATARALLLEPFDLDESRLQDALASVFTHRADYADLYFQYTRNESYSLEEGIVKSGSFDIQQGVGVRAVVGDKTAFSYSDDISAGGADGGGRGGAFDRPRRWRHAPGRPCWPPRAALGHAAVWRRRSGRLARCRGQGQAARALEQFARARDPRVKQVMANVGAEYDVMLVARSDRHADGVIAADVRPLVRMSLTVIAEQDGRREQGFPAAAGASTSRTTPMPCSPSTHARQWTWRLPTSPPSRRRRA
jgi:TldD protein